MVFLPQVWMLEMDWNPNVNWVLFRIDSSGICQDNSKGFFSEIQQSRRVSSLGLAGLVHQCQPLLFMLRCYESA